MRLQVHIRIERWAFPGLTFRLTLLRPGTDAARCKGAGALPSQGHGRGGFNHIDHMERKEKVSIQKPHMNICRVAPPKPDDKSFTETGDASIMATQA